MKHYKLIRKYPGSPELGTTRLVQNISIENEYPEFWEEVVDNNPLKLEVGKEYMLKYIHCKSNPIKVLITHFTKNGHPWGRELHGIVTPGSYELVEEVVEKDYEILLYQNIHTRVKCKPKESYNPTLFKIHSIKRLSDGEIFTVGRKVQQPNCKSNTFTITEFKLDCNNKKMLAIGNNGGICINKIEHYKQPLFTTEDGVDIFEGDSYCKVNNQSDYSLVTGFIAYGAHNNYRGLKFSTKEAAEEYILMNKPCLSINDILNKSKLFGPFSDIKNYVEKELKKFVKLKL